MDGRSYCGVAYRVCTFNAHNRVGGLGFLERRIKPDLVLGQEVIARHWPGAYQSAPLVEDRDNVGGTAIFSPSATITPLDASVQSLIGSRSPKGALTAALIEANGLEPFIAVSIYVRIDNNIAFWNAEKIVDDLEPLIETCSGRRLVIGGDFNSWDQKNDGINERWRRRWCGLWSRLEALGMVKLLRQTSATRVPPDWCRCGFDDCWHIQTVRRTSKAHADYLWATPDLAAGCQLAVIDINDSELIGVSDHSPVWADLAALRVIGTQAARGDIDATESASLVLGVAEARRHEV
jgi:Endonuclease/Exonuclease/phosphatase family